MPGPKYVRGLSNQVSNGTVLYSHVYSIRHVYVCHAHSHSIDHSLL